MTYRDLRMGYYLAVLAGALSLVALWWHKALGAGAAIGVGIVWVILCALTVNYLEHRRFVQLNELRNQCRLKEYAAACEKLYQAALARKDSRMQRIMLINRSTAYLDLGQPRQALELLESTERLFLSDNLQPSLLLGYYNNLAMCHLRLKEWDKAQIAMQQFRGAMDSPRLNQNQRGPFYLFYQIQAMLLDMGRGDYVGAEKFFLRVLEREKTPIGQVFCQACLLKVYLHQGEEAKLQGCIDFLEANGGDTCFAQAAREVRRRRMGQQEV